ncbi:ZmpA/ZmpB/ZmpC family metallo-endopeptidase, partial [Gemelliphila palaticanis]
VVTKGIKPKVERKEVEYTTEYVADENKAYGENTEVGGVNGENEIKTTYELDKTTGEIREVVGEEKVITAPTNKVVTKGTKPKVEELEIEPKIEYVYVDDKPTTFREETPGVKGLKRRTTTYTLDKATGNIEETVGEFEIVRPSTSTVVKVGTKEESPDTIGEEIATTTEITREAKTEYRADINLNKGTEIVDVTPQNEITTIKTRYKTINGVRTEEVLGTPSREVTTDLRNKVVLKGVKEVEILTSETISTIYEKDNTREKGSTNLETRGTAESKEITYISDVNSSTGELSNRRKSSEKVLAQEVPTTIKVATKETVVERESLPTIYRGDETKDYGYTNEVLGKEKETTTIYDWDINTTTGAYTTKQVSPNGITVKDGTNTVVTKGTKQKIETSDIVKEGKNYRRTTTTRYSVDERTGKITETQEHSDELISSEKVKPVVSVTRVVTDDEARTATLTYSKEDNDSTFRKVTIKVYKDDQVINTIENNLTNLDVVLNNLELYTPYKVETTVHYDLGNGDTTEVIAKKEDVELVPKRVEFRNVSSRELYKVDNNGVMSVVTGLSSVPNDKENYVVKIINDGKEIVLPVASFVESGDKIDVKVEHSKLITFTAANTTEENYKFQVEKTKTGDGIYTSFEDLVRDMANNNREVYYLGADLIATENSNNAYVNNFTKKLTSVEGKKYAIVGLKKPLINTLNGGTVENIELRDVNITSSGDTGSVAITAKTNSLISKVKVNGTINYNPNSLSTNHIGGIVGSLIQSDVSKNMVDVNINIAGGRFSNVAGLVGRAYQSGISKNYYSGKVSVTGGESPVVSAIISTAPSTNIEDNIINTSLEPTGNPYIFASNTKKVGQDITQEEANKKLKEWGAIIEETSSSSSSNSSSTIASELNYTSVRNYKASKEKAYKNTEKLLPLYDRNTIVKYGNLIDDNSNLATKDVVSVTPMKDDKFIVNLLDKEQPNKLFIKYADNTKEIVELTKIGNFKDTDIVEYSFNGNLLFTLNQFNKDVSSLSTSVKEKLSSVALDSDSVRSVLKLAEHNAAIAASGYSYKNTIADLYLDNSFEEIKNNLDTIIPKLLSNNDITYLDNETIKKTILKKVEDNKEKIMLGLSYLNRLYGINFDKFNIKDLVMFNPNFYGKNLDNIDYLIEVGSQGFESLMISNSVSTYGKTLANKLGSTDLIQFLDNNRTLFTSKSANEWFRSSTKAFIHEVKSKVLSDANVETYTRLQQKDKFKSYILPLLNLKDDDVYVVTTLSTIVFGGYGRSVDTSLKNSNNESYKQQVSEAHEKIKSEAQRWGAYNDFYLNISKEKEQNILKTKLAEVFDGYFIKDSEKGQTDEPYFMDKRRWATKYDKEYNAVYDFFGPIGRWYAKSDLKNSAYAERASNKIYFDYVDILGSQGGATLNHELVHAYDEDVLLQGFNYRAGQNTESYAYGLFESVSSAESYYYGFNFMYDITGGAHNNNISRFANKEDLQSYAKGVSDVTYLLDGLEAEIIASKSNEEKAKLLRKMEMKKVTEGSYKHANDVIKDISAQDIQSMNLRDVNDFVDNNLVARTTNMLAKEYMRDNTNNYYIVPLYYPIYAGYQNDEGTVGGLMFRRVAFDMLAEYGWDNGFVGYASNKHKQADNLVTDKSVFSSILDSKYNGSYKEFKKDMFKQRLDKKDSIKAITIDGKQITNSTQLKELLTEALNKDLSENGGNIDGNFNRQNIKAKILKAYNALTDNFKTSIFN